MTTDKKILVTGASGFIGRRLCARLQAEGHHVVALGRHACAGPWDEFLACDLSDAGCEIPLAGVASIYHLASKAHALSERPGDDSGYREIIVEGTRRILAAAERDGVAALVYLSSVKAMGEGNFAGSMLDEKTEARPRSPYGEAKLAAEQLVLASALPHVAVLRPVMVYGPGHKGNLVRMAEAIRRHRFPPLRNNGNRRSLLHVDDLVEACLAAAANPEANRETVIVAGSRSYSTRELYDRLREEMGMRPVAWHIPDEGLFLAAKLGDLLGRLLKRRMPLDTDTAVKLVGSALFDNSKSRRLLQLDYANETRPFLEE